ncbi:MAG: DUF4339 domain-containing protein [Acidobacteria bacterium]|nr:DUF4339 domain-containing protein [Acidobacteriota bacterium]
MAASPDVEDPFFLWREGQQYGPYTWDEVWHMGGDGQIYPDDLIWSESLGAWTPASTIGSLRCVTDDPLETLPRPKRRFAPFFLTLLSVLAIGTVVAWFFTRTRSPEIDDYFPKEGPAGSYVVVDVKRMADPGRLGIRYGDVPLSFSVLGTHCLGVQLPLDRPSASLRLFDGNREVDSVPFTVKSPVATVLLQTEIAPSNVRQIVKSDAGISVALPAGLVRRTRTLTVSRVKDAAVYQESPFETVDVIDVSIEGMEQLDEPIEIGIPFDPTKLDPRIPVDANFAPVRWDEQSHRWVDLFYRVDAPNHTVYLITDHLSAFWTGFSLTGLGTTAAIVTVAGGAIAEVAERWANDKYVSRNHKIRILYSDKALRKTFPDDQWKKAIAPASLYVIDGYDPKCAAAVQDIAYIFEKSLERYVEAGFPDPTQKGIGGVHIYTRYVKVKVDSLYNYYAQQGEMAHETFWDTIHLPTEILKLEFFDPVTSGRGTFEEHFLTFKALLAHELFHVIQRPYYGVMIAWTGTPHKWWREATAEWAAHDLAKIPDRSGWEKESPSLTQRIGSKFLHVPINATGKIAQTSSLVGGLDHEYLAPIFVRYLVETQGFRIKELLDAVAADQVSDPLVPLRKRLERRTDRSFDDCYADFSVWLLRHAGLQLSSFGNPQNANVAADWSDVVTIDEKETVLRVYQTKTGQERLKKVSIFRTEDGRERLTERDTPLLLIEECHPETYELSGSNGDILYFVTANGSVSDAKTDLTIQRMKDEAWENVAHRTMTVGKNGTAAIWAVKLSTGGLKIEPNRIENAKGYEKYEFDVTATSLSPAISEVTFEFDFGDYEKSSKGKQKAKVVDGKAEITLDHVYEPAPGVRKEDEPLKHVLKVGLLHDGKVLSSATAEVTVEKAEVVITPRRLIAPPGETFEFHAAARPAGTYRFQWLWPGQAKPLQTEDATSAASFTLADHGDHPVSIQLFNRKGVLLAKDQVTAAVETEVDAATPSRGVWMLRETIQDKRVSPPIPGESPSTADIVLAPTSAELTIMAQISGPPARTTRERSVATWDHPGQTLSPGTEVAVTLELADAGSTGFTNERGALGPHCELSAWVVPQGGGMESGIFTHPASGGADRSGGGLSIASASPKNSHDSRLIKLPIPGGILGDTLMIRVSTDSGHASADVTFRYVFETGE